eukprot:TRINITY_DN1460_c0_g1_i1.p1 TRINITY_DN1460_c0_g1~~TRINITY_DN1460_c0_g1_i1.p1  ORF type:complete len:357 (-),score=68.82 TRINITY_DN1460_c0_g1_i1:251-1321(-)
MMRNDIQTPKTVTSEMSEEEGWQTVRRQRQRKTAEQQLESDPDHVERKLFLRLVAELAPPIGGEETLMARNLTRQRSEDSCQGTEKHLAYVVRICWDFVNLGKLEIALDLVDKALSADDEFAPALEVKMVILLKLERYDEALNTIDALEMLGCSQDFEKLFALFALGRYDEETEVIARAIEYQSLTTLCLSCALLFKQGQIIEAMRIFEDNHAFAKHYNAITDQPDLQTWLLSVFENPRTHAESAFKIKILMELGQHESALLALEQLSLVFPKVLCDHENKEEISVVQSVLSKFYFAPEETPSTFQLCYYRRMVGIVRPELPFELTELISTYAFVYCIYDAKAPEFVWVREVEWCV